jgi:hypothetical protein
MTVAAKARKVPTTQKRYSGGGHHCPSSKSRPLSVSWRGPVSPGPSSPRPQSHRWVSSCISWTSCCGAHCSISWSTRTARSHRLRSTKPPRPLSITHFFSACRRRLRHLLRVQGHALRLPPLAAAAETVGCACRCVRGRLAIRERRLLRCMSPQVAVRPEGANHQ